jgi:hypothetical protein
MALSWKQELFCWLSGTVAAILLFAFSHTFYVTHRTFYYGASLVAVGGFLYWIRFRKKPSPQPKWLRYLGNVLLLVVSAALLLCALGVATYYE